METSSSEPSDRAPPGRSSRGRERRSGVPSHADGSGQARAGRAAEAAGYLLLALLLVTVLHLLLHARTAAGGGATAGEGAPLELAFLDVGQGDAVLLRTPDGRVALVDGGRSFERLRPHLLDRGVERLDLVVASHADADHIGGLVEAVGWGRARAFLDNGIPHATRTYERLLAAVEESGALYLGATRRTVSLGAVELMVLPPPRTSSEQNPNSVGLLLRYGSFSALLAGDSTAEEQRHWLEEGDVWPVDVYKASHHGSRSGDRRWWLEEIDPDVVVISVGGGNPYGHPHAEPLGAYQMVGARVFRTDRHGTVTVLVPHGGASGFTVSSERDGDGGWFEQLLRRLRELLPRSRGAPGS